MIGVKTDDNTFIYGLITIYSGGSLKNKKIKK